MEPAAAIAETGGVLREVAMNRSWHDELENTGTVDETVAVVRRHLDGLDPAEARSLPPCCSAGHIYGDEDVDDVTFRLAEAHRGRMRAEQNSVLDEMFDYFLHASLRISRQNRLRASGMILYPTYQMRQMG
jgi:hypothetical protein